MNPEALKLEEPATGDVQQKRLFTVNFTNYLRTAFLQTFPVD